jgi:hypothetical protein
MGLLLQPVWATYAVVSQQWGFLASTVLFTLVNARNWMRPRTRHRAARAERASENRVHGTATGSRNHVEGPFCVVRSPETGRAATRN